MRSSEALNEGPVVQCQAGSCKEQLYWRWSI